jgi:hypothetical protein
MTAARAAPSACPDRSGHGGDHAGQRYDFDHDESHPSHSVRPSEFAETAAVDGYHLAHLDDHHHDAVADAVANADARAADIDFALGHRAAAPQRPHSAGAIVISAPNAWYSIPPIALPSRASISVFPSVRIDIRIETSASVTVLVVTKSKNSEPRAHGLLMAYKLLAMAQVRWRRFDGVHHLPLMRAGSPRETRAADRWRVGRTLPSIILSPA